MSIFITMECKEEAVHAVRFAMSGELIIDPILGGFSCRASTDGKSSPDVLDVDLTSNWLKFWVGKTKIYSVSLYCKMCALGANISCFCEDHFNGCFVLTKIKQRLNWVFFSALNFLFDF